MTTLNIAVFMVAVLCCLCLKASSTKSLTLEDELHDSLGIGRLSPNSNIKLKAITARIRQLKQTLSALKYAGQAEDRAANQEKSVGGSKLKQATASARQAANLISKANTLLNSEEALSTEQARVSLKLHELEGTYKNVRSWEKTCAQGPDCSFDQEDVWSKSSLKSQEVKSKGPAFSTNPRSFKSWLSATTGAAFTAFRRSQLLAGYHLHTCLVAAEQSNETVRVRILQPKSIIRTKKGCECRHSWALYPVSGDGTEIQEEHSMRTMAGCTENGSPGEPWCAVKGQRCGVVSRDAYAGEGPGLYNWTHWDYCRGGARTVYTEKWSSTHPAGLVTCLASFMGGSSRPAGLLSLSLLAQQPEDCCGPKDAPADLAAGYEECVRAAGNAAGAAMCGTQLLRGLPSSVVRHAILITRASPLAAEQHLNRKRVLMLLAGQARHCLDSARTRDQGVCCLAQLLSSISPATAQEAAADSRALPAAAQAPEEVPALTAALVACLQASQDRLGEVFCLAKFLRNAPTQTVRDAIKAARRVRDYGAAGYLHVRLGPGSPPGLHSFCGAHQ